MRGEAGTQDTTIFIFISRSFQITKTITSSFGLRLEKGEIRDATGLIDGKIFYNGEFWSEEVYEETFPKTEIEYDTEALS